MYNIEEMIKEKQENGLRQAEDLLRMFIKNLNKKITEAIESKNYKYTSKTTSIQVEIDAPEESVDLLDDLDNHHQNINEVIVDGVVYILHSYASFENIHASTYFTLKVKNHPNGINSIKLHYESGYNKCVLFLK